MRSKVVFTIFMALAIASIASAAEVLPHHAVDIASEAFAPEAITVSEIFANVATHQAELRADGSRVVKLPAIEVIVARVEADGNVVVGCVHDEQGVNEFVAKAKPVVARPEN